MSIQHSIGGTQDKEHARAVRNGSEAIWLREHGFDGLYHESGECACLVGDLYPCGERGECRAGWKEDCTDDCHHVGDYVAGDWHITRKPKDGRRVP